MVSAADSFEALYRKHAAAVFRRAKSILGHEADAHEIVQDLFLSLYERPEQWRGQSTLSTFLYSATTHACLTRIRNQRNRLRLLQERGTQSETSTAATDNASLVRSVLDKLPPPLGEIAVYYYVDELTHEEIAQIMGCSRRHVGHCIERLHDWGRTHQGEVSCSTN